MAQKQQQAAVLRASRSLFILFTLATGFALAYLPAHPGVAVAETAEAASPTPGPETLPTPEPGSPDPATPGPTVEPAASPTVDPTAEPSPEPSTDPSPEPSPDATEPSASPIAPIAVTQYTFARVAMAAASPIYLAPGVALSDQPRFEVFRVRFDLGNADALDHMLTPTLVFAPVGAALVPVPDETSRAGAPFHVAYEWVERQGGGTTIGPSLVTQPADPASGAAQQVRSSGVNPLPVQTVRAGSTLSVEFSVSATASAAYGATYVFRLTDNGTDLPGASEATLRMSARPPLELTPGQRSGVPGDAVGRSVTRYALQPGSVSVHTPAFDLVSDSCAACHRTHTAVGSLLNSEPTQYALCASCHNGTNLPDIATAYAGVPANDVPARAYYQHDPTQTSGVLGQTNDCAECHNPHSITTAAAAETASGWTASGRVAGVSGVELEYQLCYRCHASPATLPSNAGQPPSRYALDKALELDPANVSFHPIEAAGTNQTPALANSLAAAGTSPYKLWSWQTTSTIRCVNCHADARIAEAAFQSGGSVAANADLPLHASTQRGILIQPYQDRLLNGAIEPYQAADFALCYVCHSEAPFVDQTGQVRDGQNGTTEDTNFRFHGLHLSNPDVMADRGFPGTDIDSPGFGSGFAVCAECHYRIHSSAFPADGKAPGPRLVNFAPNVTAPTGGTLGWQPRTETTAGSCTLKCHGAPHNAVQY